MILEMQLCSFVDVKSSSPSLPYIPLSFISLSTNLPQIPYLPFLPFTTSFYFPSLFPFPLNLPLSLSIFPFPSQPSPSLLLLFSTYLLPFSPQLLFPFCFTFFFLLFSPYLFPFFSSHLSFPFSFVCAKFPFKIVFLCRFLQGSHRRKWAKSISAQNEQPQILEPL